MNLKTEPVRIVAALTAVAISSVGVLVKTNLISADVAAELVTWVGALAFAAGEFVRSQVTPTSSVALTTEQADQLAPPSPSADAA